MPNLNFAQTLGIDKINMSGGTISNIALVLLISIVILALAGWLIYIIMQKRIYIYRVRVFRKIGNIPTEIGIYKAKAVPIGKAGDYLMFVKGAKKWLEFPTLQTSRNVYWFFIREDGEWINFAMDDLNEESKKAGVQFIKQDMRLARISIGEILEHRLLQKSFFEKFGLWIGAGIFFLIIAIALIIFMYQFGKTNQQFTQTATILKEAIQIAYGQKGGETQIIPASIGGLFLLKKRKK